MQAESNLLHERYLSFFGNQTNQSKYLSLADNPARVSFLYRLPVVQKLFKQDALEEGGNKSSAESKRFRELGNAAFKAGHDEKALKFYHLSVAFAPRRTTRRTKWKSEELTLYPLAVANRSAVLCRLGHWPEALRDVNLVLDGDIAHPSPDKLKERRQKCLQELEQRGQTAEKPFEQLSEFQANPRCPAMTKAITLQSAPGMGRFGMANRDILAGELLLVEQPSAAVLKPYFFDEYCARCMRKCDVWQLPCMTCSIARFCSEECSSEAQKTFHKIECGRANLFDKFLSTVHGSAVEYFRLSFRLVAQRPLSFFKERQSLFTTTSDEERFGLDDEDVYRSDDYRSTWSMVRHEARSSNFWVILCAVFNLRRLQVGGYFEGYTSNAKNFSEDEMYIAHLLIEFLSLLRYNTHSLYVQSPVPEKPFRKQLLAIGTYPTLALLNHSCDPNITKFFIGSTTFVLAKRNIRQGEEVTENYYPASGFLPRDERRSWLLEHYCFQCQCLACVENHPTFQEADNERWYRCPNCDKGSLRSSALTCSICRKRKKADEVKALDIKCTQLVDALERLKETSSDITSTSVESAKQCLRELSDLVVPPTETLFRAGEIFLHVLWTYAAQCSRSK